MFHMFFIFHDDLFFPLGKTNRSWQTSALQYLTFSVAWSDWIYSFHRDW